MKRIFIYYSLSGNGDVVAEYLEDKDVDIRKVSAIDKMPKSYIGQIITGGFLATINYKAKLIDFNNDISKYDEIIIGSPIWNSRLACPINSVLEELDLKDKKVTFIFYSGSGTSPKATEKVKELYPEANILDIKNPKDNLDSLDRTISTIL